jgi:alpha-galactosidase
MGVSLPSGQSDGPINPNDDRGWDVAATIAHMTRAALVLSTSIVIFSALAATPAQQAAVTPSELTGPAPPAGAIWLDSLDLKKMVQRRGTPRVGRSGAGRGTEPPPLMLGGVRYEHGIGTLSINELIVDLKGQATRFVSMIGIDDAARTGQGSVFYEVWLDDRRLYTSPLMKAGDAPQMVSVDVTGGHYLELFIDDGGDVSTGDYADWAGAAIYLKAGATKPETWTFPSEPAPPIASAWPATPRINPPRITGGTPGRPFLFRIPATGDAPRT